MSKVEHPRFARVWSWLVKHEPADVARGRDELLEGLQGRVLEVGAGTGANFPHYPSQVAEVVAVEPEPHLRAEAAQAAAGMRGPTRFTVLDGTFEELPVAAAPPFDAVVCSLVLCSVQDPGASLSAALGALRPGGELRYYEHVATDGWLGGLQRAVDATFWPRAFGGCHTHRDTAGAIERAGFERVRHRDIRSAPRWVPMPVAPMVLGAARRPLR